MKDQKFNLYLKSFENALNEVTENEDANLDFLFKKFVFYGVKLISNKPKSESYEELVDEFQKISFINYCIGMITPNEIENLFPIDKDYKGEKRGVKDYFSTKDFLKTLEANEGIGENVLAFLFEYMNMDLRKYAVASISCMSKLRQHEGYLDVMEEFMASQGEKTPNTFRNKKNEVLYVRNGKPEKITKSNGRHLRIVKDTN